MPEERRTLIPEGKGGLDDFVIIGGAILHLRIKKQVNYLASISTLPEGAVPMTAPSALCIRKANAGAVQVLPVKFSQRDVFSDRRQQDGVIIIGGINESDRNNLSFVVNRRRRIEPVICGHISNQVVQVPH
ncbi:MAG: hypothetical protein QOG27_873 [Verrucomicrobiota bacterium]